MPKGRLTRAAPAVLIQSVTSLTEALEGAGQVRTVVFAAAVTSGALVNICRQTGLLGLCSRGRKPGGPFLPWLNPNNKVLFIPLSRW